MRIASIFTFATVLASSFVAAAPAVSLNAVVAREEPKFDLELAIRELEDLNKRAAAGDLSLHRRSQEDLIITILDNLQSSNLFGEFISQINSTASFQGPLAQSVLTAIESSSFNATSIYNTLSASGLVQLFYNSVLSDPNLKSTALSYASKIFTSGLFNFGGNSKREVVEEAIPVAAFTVSKRDLSLITSLITAISNSGIIQDVFNYITSHPQLITDAENIAVSIFQAIPWSSLFSAIENSGIIQSLFGTATATAASKREFLEFVVKNIDLSNIN